MTTATNTALERNDGGELFILKVSHVEAVNAKNAYIKSITSAAGNLAGADPVLEKETYELTGEVRGMDPGDYPNSGTYADHDFGFAEELRRASKEWGPDLENGLDTFDWDGREIGVVITELRLEENPQETPEKQYTFTMELTAFDVYVG